MFYSVYKIREGAPLTPRVLSALRGPDHDNHDSALAYALDRLKTRVTGRLRAIVFEDYPGSYVPTQMTKEVVEEVRTYVATIESRFPGWKHFMAHLVDAVHETRNHPIWGGQADRLVDALYGGAAPAR